MFYNYFDSHVHSSNSSDAHSTLFELCESALQKGMMGFALTDHFECNGPKGKYGPRIRQSIADLTQAQSLYNGRLLLTLGIELGQPLSNIAAQQEALGFADYDFVLGSLHGDSRVQDYYLEDFSATDPYSSLDIYYQEMLEMTGWDGFDILAHMTYPLRYIVGIQKIEVNFDRYKDVLDAILSALVAHNKGLEVNTSGLHQAFGQTMPSLWIIKRYKELGGENITIGSDAHNKTDLGRHIETGMELLQEAGFRYFCFYKERLPRMLNIL